MGDPTISVLIATLGEDPRLPACLAQIQKQVESSRGELVVVFNREKDEVLELAHKSERYAERVLFEPRPGKSRALNSGIDACRGEVIAFTDDDAVPEARWLAALCAPLLEPGRDPRAMGCGGPVEPIFPPETPRWYRRLVLSKPTNFLGPHHRLGGEISEYFWEPGKLLLVPLGANCAYRREVFERYRYDPALGPNRETGIRGGEDTLLACELLRDGDKILHVPDALVQHPVEPERMDAEFVARCYFSQGRESAALRRQGFGRGMPTEAALARKLGRAERRVRWLRWLGAGASRRARFEREYRRGLAVGLLGVEAGAPGPQ